MDSNKEEDAMKAMYRTTLPTHGGLAYTYYTSKVSSGGQLLGEFKTVEDAVAATGRVFAGECDDSWYDVKGKSRRR